MIKRNIKKKARKEELIYMQHLNVCYVISIKKNYLICCSDVQFALEIQTHFVCFFKGVGRSF